MKYNFFNLKCVNFTGKKMQKVVNYALVAFTTVKIEQLIILTINCKYKNLEE